MSATNNGGPAFPVPPMIANGLDEYWPSDGMSLRDYFAGIALRGLGTIPYTARASVAYKIADAMLAERSKP